MTALRSSRRLLVLTAFSLAYCLLLGLAGFAFAREKGAALTRATLTVTNPYIEVALDDETGQWVLYTTGGDPAIASDSSLALTYPGEGTSFATLRVYPGLGSDDDPSDFVLGEDTEFVTTPAQVASNQFSCVYGTGDEAIPITVQQDLYLIHDAVFCKFTVTNEGDTSQTIGLRQMLDTQLGVNDGAPIKVLGEGIFTEEYTWTGSRVPDSYLAYDNADYPAVMAAGTVRMDGYQRPSKFVVAAWPLISATDFDYTTTGMPIVFDSAVALWWDNVLLPAGKSIEFAYRYGVGFSDNDFEGDYCLSVSSPLGLRYFSGDNPATPATEDGYLSPDPFRVYAAIANQATATLTSASMTIVLPDSLELVAGELPTKPVDNIIARREQTVNWRVKPKAGYSGEQEIRVISSCAPPGAKSLSRMIQLPATPREELPGGVLMVSFPFRCTPADAATAMGFEPLLYRYDPEAGAYTNYPTTAFNLEPGRGYWLKLFGPTNVALAGTSTVFSPFDYELALGNGWNIVGSPFPRGTSLDGITAVRLVGDEDLEVSLQEAAQRGWIKNVFYRWAQDEINPLTGQYEFGWSQEDGAKLAPWAGYWVRALKSDVRLRFTEAALIRRAEEEPVKPTWQAQIAVRTAGRADVENFLGVSEQDFQGYSLCDVDEAPRGPGSDMLRAYFDDGGLALASDIRQDSAPRIIWNFVVEAGEETGDVTLSWSDLSSIPRDMQLVMVDEATGQRTFMRTSSNYSYTAPARGVARSFTIIAEPRAQSAALVTALVCAPSKAGGYSIDFTLGEPAQVTLTVRNLAGSVVRTVTSSAGADQGGNTLIWDGLDQSGRQVPTGPYQLELVAETADGQRFNASRIITVN